MPRRTNQFQKVVFLIKKHIAAGALVTESKILYDNITGAEREVDICIESTIADHKVIVSIECRDRGRRADVQWIDEMKAKHERLPTKVLVLISKSGFSKEAEIVAQKYGIEILPLKALNDNTTESLFGATSSLWSNVFTMSPAKVVIRVPPTEKLAAEQVIISPNTLIHNHEGEILCSADELIWNLLYLRQVVDEFGKFGDESHNGFILTWEPVRDKEGNPLCFQKLDPIVLRPIESLTIFGTCSFKISEFSLKKGTLGTTKVAWGTGPFLGKKALLVASEDIRGNKKLSISTENVKIKSP